MHGRGKDLLLIEKKTQSPLLSVTLDGNTVVSANPGTRGVCSCSEPVRIDIHAAYAMQNF